MDTRQLRIGTHDAVPGTLLTNGSGFDINLENVMQQIGSQCVGFSVESIGFYNAHPTVNVGTSDTIVMQCDNYNGGEPFSVTITSPIPIVNPTPADLALEVQNAISAATGGAVNFLIVPDTVRHTFSWTQTLPIDPGSPFQIYTERNGDEDIQSNALATVMGVTGALPFFVGFMGDVLETNTWDFGGQRVAYLHSSILLHDKHSVDGEGLPMSSFVSAPITVDFLGFNQVYPNQYQRPTVSWGRKHSIRKINFRLRTIRGELFNLQNTDMYFTLRLSMVRKK